jgi:hypothetical protein
MEDEVQQQKNRCRMCYKCPICFTILHIENLSENELVLVCGTCQWNSNSIGLVGKDKLDFEVSLFDDERDMAAKSYFRDLLKSFEKPKISTGTSEKESNDNNGFSAYEDSEKFNPFSFEDPSLTLSIAQTTTDENLSSPTQILQSEIIPSSLVDRLRPSRVILHTKRTLRCRKDANANRMSILIQPKSSPLDGDSSMKSLRGKWWTKDSSAIHFVPSLILCKLPSFKDLTTKSVSFITVLI